MSKIDAKDIIYNKVPLENLLRDILRSIALIGKNASIDPKTIPFNSPFFRAKTLQQAIEESKGYVFGQIDPNNFEYKKGISIRDVLDKVIVLEAVQLNESLLELLPEDMIPERKAVGTKDCLNSLLKILIRQSEKIRELEEDLYD